MYKWWLKYRIRTIDSGAEGGGSEDSGDNAQNQGGVEPNGAQGATGADGDEKLGEGGLKALQAEREANKAAKAKIAEYESKIKEYEDKGKTEAEKEAERLASLEKSNTENAAKAERYEVAAEVGLPLKLASRIRGGDHDAMVADAKEILSFANINNGPKKPKPDMSQGNGGALKPKNLEESIKAHYKQ
jgi:hypothetical protein